MITNANAQMIQKPTMKEHVIKNFVAPKINEIRVSPKVKKIQFKCRLIPIQIFFILIFALTYFSLYYTKQENSFSFDKLDPKIFKLSSLIDEIPAKYQ